MFTFDDYLADFRAEFYDIRGDAGFADCLSPTGYAKSQALARELLASGSADIVYTSVRHTGGTALPVFGRRWSPMCTRATVAGWHFQRPGLPPLIT